MTSAQKPTAPAPAAAETADKKPVAKAVKTVKSAKAPKEPKAAKAPAKAAQKPAEKAEKKKTPAADAPKVPKLKPAPAKTAAAPAKKAPAVVAVPKPKKPKLVRDSFTIPKPEYLVLDALKLRALQLQHPIKKGELLRAGIKALASMADDAFLVAVQAVPTIKTGRPAKD